MVGLLHDYIDIVLPGSPDHITATGEISEIFSVGDSRLIASSFNPMAGVEHASFHADKRRFVSHVPLTCSSKTASAAGYEDFIKDWVHGMWRDILNASHATMYIC